ncbi:isoflavone reductase family protein-like protein CipA [Tricladium varicosporioides]|nr:isoflavone reductase family protein-like protein CipA [Hymenoscyphus varicosporioides]
MAVIKNVAIVGASGALGRPILDALIASGKFNLTAVTREGSKATFPASVKVVPVDVKSVDSVTTAFKGQDAVVSAVGMEGLLGQTVLIDAAIAAGVYRFLPSDFGSDLSNPKTAALPVFGYKQAARKHLEDALAKTPGMTYTYIQNGGFLDWGLDNGFLLGWQEGKPAIYDGGDRIFSTTTLASVGDAVVGVLSHPEETKDRFVFVEDIKTSQNKLLEMAKKIAPEKKWEPVQLDTAELEKKSNEALAKGDYSMGTMIPYLFRAIFAEGYGGRFDKTDNELLGIKGKTEAEVEEVLRKAMSGGK